MTDVSNIQSSSLVTNYLDSTSNKDVSAKEVFTKLSVDVGGDGKKISKNQLDDYIAKVQATKAQDAKDAAAAKSDVVDTSGVSDAELKGLTTLQKNWTTVSQGSDTITYSNISQNKDILTSMDSPDKTNTIDVKQFTADTTKSINESLIASALGTSNATPGTATSMLQTLLTGTTDQHDDSNAELISALTNYIASSQSQSTFNTQV